MTHRLKLALPLAAALTVAVPAIAQENNPTQPPPPAVPVGEVDGIPLEALIPPMIEGSGRAIDGDEIAIGEVVFRLDGIAAPLMTVPMGPEARVALQALIDGQRLSCDVIGRGADAQHLNGVCRVGEDDVAEAMLAGGMVAVHRLGTATDADSRERAARYDAAETEARERELGIWAPTPTADDIDIVAAPVEEPGIDRDLVRNWLSQLPLFILAIAIGLWLAGRTGKQRLARAARRENEVKALLALMLGEVLAIRAATEAALATTAPLIQDLPIPTAQLANIALPEATVFAANAGRLKDLPREVSVDLVQFYARYQVVSRILKQASALRCEQLRASLESLIASSNEPMARAEKLLA